MSRKQDNGVSPKKAAKRKSKASKKPKAGTVTFGKPSRAKGPPRPDRYGPEGRAKNAARARKQRAERRSKRAIADDVVAGSLVDKERLRNESIEALLRGVFLRVCRQLGIDAETAASGRFIGQPNLGSWAFGIYGLVAHNAGCQWTDFTNHRRSGLVAELRAGTHYSKMKPLIDATRELLADASERAAKSPVLAAMREMVTVLTAHAVEKMRALEVKHGPRPNDPPSRKQSFAKRVGKAGKVAEKAGKKIAKAKTKAKAKRTEKAATTTARKGTPKQRRTNAGEDFGEASVGRRRPRGVPADPDTPADIHDAPDVDSDQIALFDLDAAPPIAAVASEDAQEVAS